MDIEYWDSGLRCKMLRGIIQEWEKIDTGAFQIKRVLPEQKYLDSLREFTQQFHWYVHGMRTIVKINGKHIFLDSSDRTILAAESWKLPFDLIIKFQYYPDDPSYKLAAAQVVPYTYTMSHYDLSLINKNWALRQEVLCNRKFTSSMFWAGALSPNLGRKTVMNYLKRMKHTAHTHKKILYEEYFSEMATTQAGIAVAGFGDFTHRDIELMSVGNAFFRKTFQNITRNPRIPNVHYYSIGGHEVGINKTMRHFCEYFEPDGEYRNFTDEEWNKHREISYNARAWWEENGSPEGTFNLFCEILEENNII